MYAMWGAAHATCSLACLVHSLMELEEGGSSEAITAAALPPLCLDACARTDCSLMSTDWSHRDCRLSPLTLDAPRWCRTSFLPRALLCSRGGTQPVSARGTGNCVPQQAARCSRRSMQLLGWFPTMPGSTKSRLSRQCRKEREPWQLQLARGSCAGGQGDPEEHMPTWRAALVLWASPTAIGAWLCCTDTGASAGATCSAWDQVDPEMHADRLRQNTHLGRGHKALAPQHADRPAPAQLPCKNASHAAVD